MRLQALEDFKLLKAPFEGIVTARNTDIGAVVSKRAETCAASTPSPGLKSHSPLASQYYPEGMGAEYYI